MTIETSYRMLGLSLPPPTLSRDSHIEILRNHCKSAGAGLSVYSMAGDCVFGYMYKEINDVWTKHISVPACIEALGDMAENIKKDMEILRVDMSNINLTYIEDEEILYHYPEPMVLNW